MRGKGKESGEHDRKVNGPFCYGKECLAGSAGDVSATGCGAKTLALSQCEEAACETNCPVSATDPGAFDALLACHKHADTTSCKTYADDAACAAVLEDAGVAAVCTLSGATFADNAKPMVKLFCGGIVADAGDGG